MFDFIMLVFIVDNFWKQAFKVFSMLRCFFVGDKESIMENWVNTLGRKKLQVRIDRRNRKNFKRTMTFWS
jgi:hypothetical protein